MKKLLAIFLSLTFLVNLLSLPAAALETADTVEGYQEDVLPTQILLKENPDGTYTLLDSSLTNQMREIEPYKTITNNYERNYIYAQSEVDMDILYLQDDQYLTCAYDNTYVKTDRINIDTFDFDKNYSNFEKYGICEDKVAKIKEMVESQREMGNTEFEYSIYISEPFTISTSEMSTRANNVEVLETDSARGYITPHLSVSNGTSTKGIASGLISLAISIGGIFSGSVSILSTGASALSAFEAYINQSVSVPLASDWQQIQFKYDWLKRTGYVHTTIGKQVGCVAQKLWIDKLYYYQFYGKYKDIVLKKNPRGDGSYKTTNSINQTHTTPSWNNIANIDLYNWTNPVIDKDITTKIHKTSFTFKSYS